MSLKEALESGRIMEFIAQEEARGVGVTTKREFSRALKILIKSKN